MHSKTIETCQRLSQIGNYYKKKTSFNKGKPNIINYRCYKQFNENKFKQELSFQLSEI